MNRTNTRAFAFVVAVAAAVYLTGCGDEPGDGGSGPDRTTPQTDSFPGKTVPFHERGEFVATSPDAPSIECEWPLGTSKMSLLPVAAVGARPGDHVADIGCGSGFHSKRIAKAVGETGRVYSRDIDKQFITHLESIAGGANFDVRTSTEDDVNIPADTLDIALLADVYHYVMYGQEKTKDGFMKSLYRAMKPGGVVVVSYVWASGLFGSNPDLDPRTGTLADFREHGYTPGRRWSFRQPSYKAYIAEFRKPTEPPSPR